MKIVDHRVRAIIVDSGKIALIRRVKTDEEYYVIPGGGVDSGEDVVRALQREVFEELGITVKVGKLFAELRRRVVDDEEIQSFYYCTQTGGEFGTGRGPEFDPESGHAREGTYTPVRVSLSAISGLTIYPSEIKIRLLKSFAIGHNSMCIFYIVRHGETHANAGGLIQGQSDFALTENGENQAAHLGKKFKEIHFAAAFSSDLIRARRTAEIVTLERKLAINTSHLLRERNFGKYEGKPQELFREENKEFLRQLAALPYEEGKKLKAAEDIENDDDLTGRFVTFLRELAATYEGKTVLVVTHAGVMRAFLRHIGHDLSNGFIENTAYFKLRSDGINFFVDETSGIAMPH